MSHGLNSLARESASLVVNLVYSAGSITLLRRDGHQKLGTC